MLIRRPASLLLVIDIQEKLAPAIDGSERVIANSVRLLDAARQLGVPAFVSEQYVRGLGPSLEAIRAAASIETPTGPKVDAHIFEKTHFSCTAEPDVLERLRAVSRPQAILTGTEAHVCVLQTAFGLHDAGFEVFVVADAVASRHPDNRSAALERLSAGGMQIVTTEMVLFEWLHQAGTNEFRALLPLLK